MMNNCSTCKHSKKAPSRKTYLEKWEEDTRPVSKWWQGWWDPSKYKLCHPYEDEFWGTWYETEDKSILYDNEHKLICQRFPDHEYTYDILTCGEYVSTSKE